MANIVAEKRNGTGKGVARKLRVEGRIPAVVYGAGKENQNISLSTKELTRLMEEQGAHLFSHRHDLKVGTRGAKEAVLIRDIHVHPVSGLPEHVDFLRIDPNKKIDLQVPLRVVDDESSPGVKRGGIVQLVTHFLDLRCKAGAIPEEVEISVGGMEIGDTIHLQDVKLPEGSEVVHTEENFAVVSIVGVKVEAATTEEGEEAGEGEL